MHTFSIHVIHLLPHCQTTTYKNLLIALSIDFSTFFRYHTTSLNLLEQYYCTAETCPVAILSFDISRRTILSGVVRDKIYQFIWELLFPARLSSVFTALTRNLLPNRLTTLTRLHYHLLPNISCATGHWFGSPPGLALVFVCLYSNNRLFIAMPHAIQQLSLPPWLSNFNQPGIRLTYGKS